MSESDAAFDPSQPVQNIYFMRIVFQSGSFVQMAICNINQADNGEIFNQFARKYIQVYGSYDHMIAGGGIILVDHVLNMIPGATKICSDLQTSSAPVAEVADFLSGLGYDLSFSQPPKSMPNLPEPNPAPASNPVPSSTPESCLFNGSFVPHSSTVTAYKAPSVPFGSVCEAESRHCDNGFLDGSNQYPSCDPDLAKSCLFNGTTVPHGESVAAYRESSAPAGTDCSGQMRHCSNGYLDGSYTNSGCSIAQAPTPTPQTNPAPSTGGSDVPTVSTTPAPAPTPATIPPPVREPAAIQPPSSFAEACPSSPSVIGQTTGEGTCTCGPVNMNANVWGSGTFTHDSDLCAAARFSGHLTVLGGPIKYFMSGPQNSFPAQTSYGISTRSWGPWNASFVITDAGLPQVKSICYATVHRSDNQSYSAAKCDVTAEECNQIAANLANAYSGDGITITSSTAHMMTQEIGNLLNTSPLICEQMKSNGIVMNDLQSWLTNLGLTP